MADATTTQPGIDPDRASFTIALNTARDLIVQAAGITADTVIDLVGQIGRLVLANLMPDRRVRTNPRTVKRAMSKYNAKTRTINRATYKATISIDILNLVGLDDRPGTPTDRHWGQPQPRSRDRRSTCHHAAPFRQRRRKR